MLWRTPAGTFHIWAGKGQGQSPTLGIFSSHCEYLAHADATRRAAEPVLISSSARGLQWKRLLNFQIVLVDRVVFLPGQICGSGDSGTACAGSVVDRLFSRHGHDMFLPRAPVATKDPRCLREYGHMRERPRGATASDSYLTRLKLVVFVACRMPAMPKYGL